MSQVNLYDPYERQREKQYSREQDDRDLIAGVVSVGDLSVRNSLFGSMDLSRARIRSRGRMHA